MDSRSKGSIVKSSLPDYKVGDVVLSGDEHICRIVRIDYRKNEKGLMRTDRNGILIYLENYLTNEKLLLPVTAVDLDVTLIAYGRENRQLATVQEDRMTIDQREAMSNADPGLSRALGIAKEVQARVNADRMDDLAILARAVFDMHERLFDMHERLEKIRSDAEDHRWD